MADLMGLLGYLVHENARAGGALEIDGVGVRLNNVHLDLSGR